MNESILNSGFPQVAPEPKPFSLYDQTPNAQANPSRDNAQPFNLTPFTFAVAEKVATAANERMLSYDVMGQALKGKTPMEYFDELGAKAEDVGTTNDKYNTEIERLNDEIRRLKPQQADDTGYRAAMDAFNNLASQAPLAPTLERLNVSDTDKIMLGFALLTGANPNDAIGNFIKVKQGFVDQSNEQAMGQYKLDASNFGNQIDAAGTRITQERQLLGDTQQSFDRQYDAKLDSLGQQVTQLATTGRTEEANRLRGQHNASQAVQRKYIAQGIYTQADYNKDAQAAIDNGFDPAQMVWPPINVPTAAQANMTRDDRFRDTKYADDKKRFEEAGKLKATKQNFDISMKSWMQYLANLNRVGIVDENDIAELTAIRSELSKKYGFPENTYPLPKVGTTWQRIMAEASGKRQDAAATRQIGGQLVDQYWNKRKAALDAFDTATEPLKKAFEDEGEERERLADAQRKAQDKFQESNSSSDEKAFETARQAYQNHLGRYQVAQQKYQSRTEARGRLVDAWDSQMPSDNIFGGQPFYPTSGNAPPNPDGFVVDKFPKPENKPSKPKPNYGSVGRPTDVRPGDKSNKGKTLPKVENPSPKPQPKPKPAESKPDAKKGQSSGAKKKADGITFNPNPR